VSAENVELVRWLQPPPEIDLAELFQRDADADAVQGWLDAMDTLLTEDFACAFHALGQDEHRGAAGLRAIWLDWLEPWESYRSLSQELIDLGDRVLVLPTDVGRRRGMGEEVEMHGATLWTIRERKVARVDFFARREDGLAAAGIQS
jgi:ketosteroid isomerase-like protein